MGNKVYKARLKKFEGRGTWTYVSVPFDAAKIFGQVGQIKIKGSINGVPFRSSLMPNGDGSHFLVVNKSVRDRAQVKCGAIIEVALAPDQEARIIRTPGDLKAVLSRSRAAQAEWDRLSYSHKKEYVDWITSAKKDGTRKLRLAKAASMLAGGRTAKSRP